MRRTARTVALVVAVAAASILTACANAEEPLVALPSVTTSTPSESPTPTPSISPTGTPQQQILDAYLGMQHAFAKASQTANPEDPELSRYAADTALIRLRDGLMAMRSKGLRARGETVYHPKVESLEPAGAPRKARVRDCMDTSKTEAYKANGDPYTDTPGGLRLAVADLEIVNGTWKVTGLGVHKVGSCAL